MNPWNEKKLAGLMEENVAAFTPCGYGACQCQARRSGPVEWRPRRIPCTALFVATRLGGAAAASPAPDLVQRLAA
ncbi:hypothetical protein GUJ93_ZPchr0008g12367 [Zizania palustris]|uniref:Uncharacterized protein n=1 Tax=Zizania palustris TaxID=103762 RepID=A0A8J5RIY1_ZIZPA|nr:hypothetical protein GUJ93_ZPchr0008g12367 [Zizania palustris]